MLPELFSSGSYSPLFVALLIGCEISYSAYVSRVAVIGRFAWLVRGVLPISSGRLNNRAAVENKSSV